MTHNVKSSRVGDLDYEVGGILGEKPEWPHEQGTKTTADSIASASSGAIIKELKRHDAVSKAPDENKLFSRERVHSPVTVTAVILG